VLPELEFLLVEEGLEMVPELLLTPVVDDLVVEFVEGVLVTPVVLLVVFEYTCVPLEL
jgi:hypothetical protein